MQSFLLKYRKSKLRPKLEKRDLKLLMTAQNEYTKIPTTNASKSPTQITTVVVSSFHILTAVPHVLGKGVLS